MDRQDAAVSTVIGAIVVLGVMATALVYVNAFHVPRQGAALEVQTAERAESALLGLATALSSTSGAPSVHDVTLRTARSTPPLLSGVVLSPARSEGSVALNASGPLVSVSVLLDEPAGGVPSNDPMRVAEGGKMRVFLLGNSTAGTPVGSLRVTVGGAYTPTTEYRVEAGAVLRDGTTSTLVSPPALAVQRAGTALQPTTALAWTLPLLGGTEGNLSGAAAAQIGLTPGPVATLGGGSLVYNLTIRVNTSEVAAWRSAFEDLVGSNGYVNVTLSGAADNGTVAVDVAPPSGTPPTTKAVEFRLWAVRHEVSIGERAGG